MMQFMGVRMTYMGHIRNVVQTSVYRTTEENYEACLIALAALEEMSVDAFRAMLMQDPVVTDANLKIELYRSYGGDAHA